MTHSGSSHQLEESVTTIDSGCEWSLPLIRPRRRSTAPRLPVLPMPHPFSLHIAAPPSLPFTIARHVTSQQSQSRNVHSLHVIRKRTTSNALHLTLSNCSDDHKIATLLALTQPHNVEMGSDSCYTASIFVCLLELGMRLLARRGDASAYHSKLAGAKLLMERAEGTYTTAKTDKFC